MASGNTIKYGAFTFTQDKIKDGTMYRSRDLLSASLEVDTLTVTVECDTPTITKFKRNAQLVRYYNDDQDGTFYVQSIKRIAPKLYTITATSKVGLLSGGQHMGGIYSGDLAGDVIRDICGDVAVMVKSNISGIKLYGWLPISTPRENLAQVLFATGATVKEDRDGTLRVEGLWDGMSSIISADRIYEDSSVDYDSDVSGVSVTEHQYTEGGELTSLFEGTAAQGDIITFSEPHYDLVATGFTIVESGANYAKVSAGSGTLQGRPYIHNTREITRTVNADAAENVKTVRSATLVSLVNSKAVAERMVNYYKCVESISAPTLYDRELPGDRLGVYHPFDEAYTDACLESESVTLSGTLKAQEKSVVGFVPILIEREIMYEYQQLIAEDMTWTVPEGVTEARLVIIGGGSGGSKGSAGSNGQKGGAASASAKGGSGSSDPGSGGSGGNPGNPGQGGRILTVDISVTGGTRNIVVSVGAGGVGETETDDATSGGETTVAYGDTLYSSANGVLMDYGFQDVLSGVIYGRKGNSGLAGASGGAGGEYTAAKGNSGENLDPNTGGAGGSSSRKWGPSFVYKYTYNTTTTTGNLEKKNGGDVISGYFGYTFDSSTGKFTLTNNGSYTFPSGGTVNKSVYAASGNGIVEYAYSNVAKGNTTYYTPQAVASASAYTTRSGGGGGGGAAYGNDGYSASDADGANGADALPPAAADTYGTGGTGGNGGGGGGGGGGNYIVTNENYTSTATVAATGNGIGGAGSGGGDGAHGCVLVYYGIPKKDESGVIKDKTGKKMIDKYNRLLIV